MLDALERTLTTPANTRAVHRSLGLVAVTGSTGFIGTHLLRAMRCEGLRVLPLVRRHPVDESAPVVDLSSEDSITEALRGVDVVIHCAGYAHAHEDISGRDQEKHQLINCDYALNAARAAARAGARRFVFCSSVKAVGDPGKQCVDESFAAAPDTPYGRAKRAAEEGLARISASTGLEVVVLRLAMVYGPGSRGNLERMLRFVARGWFPPLPETGNKRSMVHVSDAVTALLLAAQHPMAAGRTYIVAHPNSLSGRELYQAMRFACSLPPSSWSVPTGLLRVAGVFGDVVGKALRKRVPWDSQTVHRLLHSACYSSAALRRDLNWMPEVDIAQGLKSVRDDRQRSESASKRIFDCVLALILAAIAIVPCAVIALVIRLTSKGPVLYWSDRVGRNNALFSMPKFRTMYVGAPAVATHLLTDAERHITPVGRFLRKTSLDELPQILSVLVGHMSFVGPRPALFNQHDLVALRTEHSVHRLRPGITGWAQVNGRDELSIEEKVGFDRQYLERASFAFDLKILVRTVLKVIDRQGVAH